MKSIEYNRIAGSVCELASDCCINLSADTLDALKAAHERETHNGAKEILASLIENAEIAKDKKIPICQDTGLAVVFIDIGSEVAVTPPSDNPSAALIDAVNEGVAAGYEKALLRKSVVAEPLKDRHNTGTNTPAVVHPRIVPGDEIEITLMAKGGGCENKSQFRMFNPTDDEQAVLEWVTEVVRQAGANACPPLVVGVGIGGSFEQCCLLSKRSLLRPLGQPHKDKFYAELESRLLEKINSTGIGPQGLGGDTTALAVKIETAPCHIASLPVAVNIECHAHRHKSIVLRPE